MRSPLTIACILVLLTTGTCASAENPTLREKAQHYCDYVQEWASGSRGGVCEQMFTDDSLTELDRLRGSGDSTIWTGMYLASQALRYMATGEEEARREVLRIAAYLHEVKEITKTPGYIARYAALDEEPWNREYGDDHPAKIPGTEPYDGYFWIDNTSRDQYTGWWLGLTLAHEAVDDAAMRGRIETDFKDVIDTLVANNWFIVDQNGVVDGNGAAAVLPSLRLSWVLQAASVGADPSYWDLFEELYDQFAGYLWIDTFSFPNKYAQYFGFNLSHNTWLPVFRLLQDQDKLSHIFRVWKANVRQWVAGTHNAWFDAVYLAGCRHSGGCSEDEVGLVADDILNTLTVFRDSPNRAFSSTPPELPIDPLSLQWEELEQAFPFMEEVWNMSPQTLEPHDFADRCWSDMVWQRSPYHISCPDQPSNRVGPGVDYLIAYWTAHAYGLLPGTCTDRDGDGYGTPGGPACTYTASDCDDARAGVHPGAREVCGAVTCDDGLDNDCDGDPDGEDPDCRQWCPQVASSSTTGTLNSPVDAKQAGLLALLLPFLVVAVWKRVM